MSLTRIWRRLFQSQDAWDLDLEDEVEQEIETHLELRAAALVQSGMQPEEARREARRRFGDVPAAVDALRQGARRRHSTRRHRATLDSLWSDLKLALRQVRHSPRFTLITLATFAFGIAATTSTFTLVRAVVLDPLPFPEADRLVALQSMDSAGNIIPVVSSANWQDWKGSARSLESTALYAVRRMAVELDQEPVRVDGALVTADFFRVLRAPLVMGRGFTAEETEAREPVVMVSEALWHQLPTNITGTSEPTLRIDSRSYRVIGVVRNGREFPGGVQIFLPFRVNPQSGTLRNNINWIAIGRLQSDVTLAQAEGELNRIARGIRQNDPAGIYSYGVPVSPLKTFVIGDAADYLTLLLGAVVLVLLVACANLAAAHLARGLVRTRETAVRAALGADRSRLIQQVLIEHGLLGLVGGGIGLLLSFGAVKGIMQLWGDRIPRSHEVSVDLPVIAFAFLLSLVAGLVTGLGPALQGSRPELTRLIAAGGRGQVRGGRGLPGGRLIAIELALAVVLLSGAGLLIRSLQNKLSVQLGFDLNVVTVSATLSDSAYRGSPARRMGYWDQMTRELASIPGVQASGVANWIPLGQAGGTFVELEDKSAVPGGFGYRTVSEGYFDALGVPLTAGRKFGPEDVAGGERVVIINQRAAELAWPGQNPIGRRLRAISMESAGNGGVAPLLTVVGVVGDVRHWGPYGELKGEMYTLFRQVPDFSGAMTVVGRTGLPAASMIPSVRARLKEIDPSVALELGTLEDTYHRMLGPARLPVTLLTGFGIFALLLTALGLYGLLSYSVSQRTREFALRAALGADRGQLISAAAVDGVKLVLVGVGIGLVSALGLSRYIESQLTNVTRFDPLTYGLVVLLLLVVALLSILLPTISGTRLDPASALNAE